MEAVRKSMGADADVSSLSMNQDVLRRILFKQLHNLGYDRSSPLPSICPFLLVVGASQM